MKLNKKFLSCFMAATMMVSPATVFAADTVDVASGTVNGSGTVHYVNTQVYNIILPTDKALDFHIDPYGLLSMTAPDITVSDALSNAAAAATNITSNATAVINKSSVAVNVAVEAMVHNGNGAQIDPTNPSAAAVKLVDDPSKVKEASDASYAGVYLAITPISGASITSLTTGPASNVTNLSLNSANVANKTVTGDVFTLSDAAFNLTGSTLLSNAAYAITSNGDAANPTKFDIDLKGMPEAYKITSTASVAVLDESLSTPILSNAVSASAVSFMFNITGKVDYTSPVWQEFDPDQNVNGQQKIELQVKFIITKAKDVQTTTSVTFAGGAADIYLSKSDFSTKPTGINLIYAGKTYNLSTLSDVVISETDSYYKVSVSNYAKPPAAGSTAKINVMNGATILHSIDATF